MENASIWSVLAGIICGVLFIFFEKGFVVLYTAAVGAYLITAYVSIHPLVFYGFLLAGTLVQLWMSKGSRVKGLEIQGR